jgi:G3E family GTPase
MRLLLFAGFLGSGKTTLIVSVARRAGEAGQRLCVIVKKIREVVRRLVPDIPVCGMDATKSETVAEVVAALLAAPSSAGARS